MNKKLIAIKGSDILTEQLKLYNFFKVEKYSYTSTGSYYFFDEEGDFEVLSGNTIVGEYLNVKLFDTVDEALDYLNKKTKIKDLFNI